MYYNDQNTQFPLLQTEPRKLYIKDIFIINEKFNPVLFMHVVGPPRPAPSTKFHFALKPRQKKFMSRVLGLFTCFCLT